MDWLEHIDQQLSKEWPEELPLETSSDFWLIACREEQESRAAMTQKIARLIATQNPNLVLRAWDQWIYRRRVEFAAQLCIAGVQRQLDPGDDLRKVLHYLLIESWERNGCIAFWNHAVERDGKPHPENPDGCSPLPD